MPPSTMIFRAADEGGLGRGEVQHGGGDLLRRAEAAQRHLALDLRGNRRVTQVAKGWEDRLWIATDEIIEFDTLLPVIQDLDALDSGVSLRVTHEVLGGTWEALAEGRADLVTGATNEPPALAGVQWPDLGDMSWVCAVAPRHPLARAKGPLSAEQIRACGSAPGRDGLAATGPSSS